MRQLFLDTETTGLSAEGGDRVIELGCVELVNRKLTGNNLHFYFNPGRDSHEDALKVHGISNEFLLDKPKFFEIFEEFLEFIRDAELIIHNASFDVGFIDKELSSCGALPLQNHVVKILDTLAMAKEILCGFGVDVDAVAGWLGSYGGEDSPDDISRGLFAGEVGSPRLLKLFERMDIKTTWFIPGHSIETFPAQMKAVADAGH